MLDDKGADKEIKELYSAFNDMSERLSKYNEQTIESLTFERNKLESVLMSIVNGVVVYHVNWLDIVGKELVFMHKDIQTHPIVSLYLENLNSLMIITEDRIKEVL